MTIGHLAVDTDGAQISVFLDKHPDHCPLCNHGISPKFIVLQAATAKSVLKACFRCPRSTCQELFIATYGKTGGTSYSLQATAPRNLPKPTFPDTISQISPTSIEILSQVNSAESNGLMQLVGIGLRKALEFLIKDYLIFANPVNAEDIKKKMLGPCITDYVEDPNIKTCAARAVWLGNDETHYVRKWENKDITDLKQLIKLTVNWIDSALLTQKYLKEMDPKSK